jgi:hypothetical protein
VYLPIVSLSASGTVVEDGTGRATFTAHRTGSGTVINQPLVVQLHTTGLGSTDSASEGSDYQPINEITIPAGANDGSVDVVPLNDTDAEGVESIYKSVSASYKYTLAAVPAIPPSTNETTAVAYIDDDVNVQTVQVWRTNWVGDHPENHDFNRFDGYDFSVKIGITGEHLDRIKIEQDVLSKTAMKDYNTGQYYDPSKPEDREFILGIVQQKDSDAPPALINNGDYEVDPSPGGGSWAQSDIQCILGTHFGRALYGDWQSFGLLTDDNGAGVKYTQVTTRIMKFKIRLQLPDQGPELDFSWGYSWTNEPCEWTAANGAPVNDCAASNQHGGIGEFDSDGVEGLDELN